MQVDDTRLDLAAERVDVGKIQLTGGTVRAWRDEKGSINLMELMKPAGAETAVSAATEAAHHRHGSISSNC